MRSGALDDEEGAATRRAVVVEGELALVVDATVAALRSHGVDARPSSGATAQEALPTVDCFVILLVPARAEAAVRAARRAASTGLEWGAIAEAPTPAVTDTLLGSGASWVLEAEAGLDVVLAALGGASTVPTSSPDVAQAPDVAAVLAPESSAALRLSTLTLQERAALDAMAAGCSVSETAALLGLSLTTVRADRREVRHKLGVGSERAAVAQLLEHQAAVRASKRTDADQIEREEHPAS